MNRSAIFRRAAQIWRSGDSGYYPECRGDIPPGQFGSYAPYWCEGLTGRSGSVFVAPHPVWETPEEVCVSRGSWDSPAEYEWICPDCGHSDVYEWRDHNNSFKAVNRKKIRCRFASSTTTKS